MSTDHVQHLAAPTAQALQAALRVPTVTSIVYELVANALTADASEISVTVDLTQWSIECVDNGRGMGKSLATGVPRRAPASSDYGMHRGDTLSLLSYLGLLEVRTSRSPADGRWAMLQRVRYTSCQR